MGFFDKTQWDYEIFYGVLKLSGFAVGLVKSQWGYIESYWDSLSMGPLQVVVFGFYEMCFG